MSKKQKTDITFSLIGQEAAKCRMGFLIRAANKGAKFKPVIFLAQKGGGKTELARQCAENFTDVKGRIRPFMEVNASDLANSGDFVQNIIEKIHELSGQPCTVFIDEAHQLSKAVQTKLLSTFNTETSPIRSYMHQGEKLVIDLRQVAFLFATTDPQKLLPPLLDRFERISLCHYSELELVDIVKLKAEKLGVVTDEEVFADIASRSRMSARTATGLADELRSLADTLGEDFVALSDWQAHVEDQGLKPYGLLSSEERILRILDKHGSLKVGELAAKMGLVTAAIQSVEEFLIQRGWITRLDGRSITTEGRIVVRELEKLD